MGTNFYFVKAKNVKKCGERGIHIGKSSIGWKFSFHGYKERQIESFADWIKMFRFFPKRVIVDEYGHTYTAEEFIVKVSCKFSEPNDSTESAKKNGWDRFTPYWHDASGHPFQESDFS